MRLVKLPSGVNKNQSVYINPDNVTYLYEANDMTYVVTTNTGSDECGYKIPMPIDEVAGRLMNGNMMYEIISELKENNEDGDNK